MRKDSRKALPQAAGTRAWIRFDDGFSVRPCQLLELSSNGARIVVDSPHDVADRFLLLLSRDASPGRRCRVKGRNGSEIDAEFVGNNRATR
jgi:hypothetical protein